ncbi:MAG: hypothetical protein HN846_01865 [Candidatus Pacebacteria bacterium]|jgi:hypothetical protein|nr:hypothetical protein [Candidatus Paceibacterota bacterium]MBT3512009.1 hypothetical protein [Candidatus Paceibacterota bacterium]MBT4004861.1 hypothetical protein [Candidatus Paceibacterota bacterium]MBT4359040.1 hypothetical protein [Candidatus Paceibacterota bacterium]MBT4680527.1 hypothetical protein [Candidatus Paceibacterota bacterium]
MADDKKKSPLDILEDVLEDAKGASQAKKATQQAEESKKKKEDLAAMGEQKKAEEAILIQEQLDKMKEISQDPAVQARRSQDQAEVNKSQNKESSQDGYEIHQLGHKKV